MVIRQTLFQNTIWISSLIPMANISRSLCLLWEVPVRAVETVLQSQQLPTPPDSEQQARAGREALLSKLQSHLELNLHKSLSASEARHKNAFTFKERRPKAQISIMIVSALSEDERQARGRHSAVPFLLYYLATDYFWNLTGH